MADTSITAPVTISPALLAKIRAAVADVDPGAHGKIRLILDDKGNLTATVGTRMTDHVTIGAFVQRQAGGAIYGGVEGVIQWDD